MGDSLERVAGMSGESSMVAVVSGVVGEEPKVLRSVVALDSISVMCHLFGCQLAPDLHTEDDAREPIPMTVYLDSPPTAIQISPALPVGALIAITPEHRVLVAAIGFDYLRSTDATMSVALSTRFERILTHSIEIIPK